MQRTEYKIFILKTNKKVSEYPERIIIWSENEEEARAARSLVPCATELRDSSSRSIPILPDSPYINHQESTCEELKEGKDYNIIEKDQHAVKIKLIANQEEYVLHKNTHLDLSN